MQAIRNSITRLYRTPCLASSFHQWLSAIRVRRRRRNLRARAAGHMRQYLCGSLLRAWCHDHRRWRRNIAKTRVFVDIWRGHRTSACFSGWHAHVRASLAYARARIVAYQRVVTNMTVRLEADGMGLVDVWIDYVNDEQNEREVLYERAKSEQQRSDELELVKKRHHSELSDWRREFEAKLKDHKDKLKGAEDSLKPLQIWRWYAKWLAVILTITYVTPTIPAILPGIYWIVRQLDFPHWFVGMLIWVFLGGAVLRLIKWLSTSVLPPGPLKAAYRWIEEWGLDSISIGIHDSCLPCV